MSWPQGSQLRAEEEQPTGCKDQGCFDIRCFPATLNLSHRVITGAIISSLSKNSAELNWRGAKMGTRNSACTHTKVIYFLLITSLDNFLVFRQVWSRFWIPLTAVAGKSQICFPRLPSEVIVVVYHSESHVPKMNSVVADNERELFRLRFWLG